MDRRSPEVTAFSIAAEFGVFRRPVIAQRVFLRNRDMMVVFWEDWGAWRDRGANGRGQQNEQECWEVKVTFPRGKASPRVETEGIEGAAGSPRDVALGEAVVAACIRLEEDRAPLQLPAAVFAEETDDGYWVGFARLPRVPGGTVDVKLSKDLKQCSLIRGH